MLQKLSVNNRVVVEKSVKTVGKFIFPSISKSLCLGQLWNNANILL